LLLLTGVEQLMRLKNLSLERKEYELPENIQKRLIKIWQLFKHLKRDLIKVWVEELPKVDATLLISFILINDQR
jgi:hypothetical protein